MTDRVLVNIDAHVAEVTLNRADKLNAFDLPMFAALSAAADRIRDEKSVRAVVLRGSGGNFSAGIDMNMLGGADFDFMSALNQAVDPSPANLFQRAAYAWRELDVPVICALEGVVYGAGLQVALGADIRYASPNARLSIMESKWGLIPDMALTATLRHLVPPDRVKELSWSARVLGSDEAHALGLVTAVVDDPLTGSREMAANCAAKSPDAIRGIKALVNQGWQMSEAEALALEARLQGAVIGRPNQIEAVAANLGKRKPRFND